MRKVELTKNQIAEVRNFLNATKTGQIFIDYLESKMPVPRAPESEVDASFLNGRVAGFDYCLDCIENLIKENTQNG